jgi:hypothetical protein
MRYRWDPSYPTTGRRSSATADPDMRVSDDERNEMAETLSRHFADGRLDQAEFKERLDQAMGAKTRGDLAGLCDDLPRLARPAAVTEHTHRRGRRLLPFLMLLALLAVGTSWTFPYWGGFRFFHISWVLVVIVGYFWLRSGRRFHHHHHVDGVER